MASLRRTSISSYAKLCDSWPGRVYTNQLKKYAVFSRCIKWIWRNGYPLHIAISLFKREQKRWRTLGKLTEFRNHGHGIHGDFSVASNCIGDLLKDFEK
jgi:hypothetical protein